MKIIKQNNSISYSPIQKIDITGRKEGIKIYPNPAKDHIIIQGMLPVDARIKLLSTEGKIVFVKHVLTNQQSLQLDLPVLTSGIYFLQINSQVKKITIR
ncbi:MAG: T9SS type A sorting domain-containing protein [Bacteroidota bacterium]